MSNLITITMDWDTYLDLTNLVKKRDEKRIKMRERYYQNKAKTVEKKSGTYWFMHPPTFEIEISPSNGVG